MIDNPEQAERLLVKMQAALPLAAWVTPEIAATLQAKNFAPRYRRPARLRGLASRVTRVGSCAAWSSRR
jgi:hypothetical protein